MMHNYSRPWRQMGCYTYIEHTFPPFSQGKKKSLRMLHLRQQAKMLHQKILFRLPKEIHLNWEIPHLQFLKWIFCHPMHEVVFYDYHIYKDPSSTTQIIFTKETTVNLAVLHPQRSTFPSSISFLLMEVISDTGRVYVPNIRGYVQHTRHLKA